MTSTIRSSNLFKEMKSSADAIKKGKTVLEYLSLGAGTSTAVMIILKTIGLVTVSNPLTLTISAGCIGCALLYKVVPDSYVVLRKRITEMKDKEISEKELSELLEIKKVIDGKLDVIGVNVNTPRGTNRTQNTLPFN